jgi:hypothetical protein
MHTRPHASTFEKQARATQASVDHCSATRRNDRDHRSLPPRSGCSTRTRRLRSTRRSSASK